MELIRADVWLAVTWSPYFPGWSYYSKPVILPPHKF